MTGKPKELRRWSKTPILARREEKAVPCTRKKSPNPSALIHRSIDPSIHPSICTDTCSARTICNDPSQQLTYMMDCMTILTCSQNNPLSQKHQQRPSTTQPPSKTVSDNTRQTQPPSH